MAVALHVAPAAVWAMSAEDFATVVAVLVGEDEQQADEFPWG